jgi:hypothetical protein
MPQAHPGERSAIQTPLSDPASADVDDPSDFRVLIQMLDKARDVCRLQVHR